MVLGMAACSGTANSTATETLDPAAAAASDPAAAGATSDVAAAGPAADSGQIDTAASATDPADPESLSSPTSAVNALEVSGEILSEYSLASGDCFNRVDAMQSGRRLTVTSRVDCAERHYAEVFHTFEIEAEHPAIYPGDDAMREFALRACYDQFESFVGTSYELSVFEIDVFTPNRTNFEHAASRYRGVHCWLYHVHGDPLVGSAAGSTR